MVSGPVRTLRLMAPFVVFVPSAALAADWPNCRGTNHDGICSETGLRTQWDQPVPLVWKRAVLDGADELRGTALCAQPGACRLF
jgi:hypothetical protein